MKSTCSLHGGGVYTSSRHQLSFRLQPADECQSSINSLLAMFPSLNAQPALHYFHLLTVWILHRQHEGGLTCCLVQLGVSLKGPAHRVQWYLSVMWQIATNRVSTLSSQPPLQWQRKTQKLLKRGGAKWLTPWRRTRTQQSLVSGDNTLMIEINKKSPLYHSFFS